MVGANVNHSVGLVLESQKTEGIIGYLNTSVRMKNKCIMLSVFCSKKAILRRFYEISDFHIDFVDLFDGCIGRDKGNMNVQ